LQWSQKIDCSIDRNMSHENAKRAASIKALEFVKDGMTLGLGTGSTAEFFIQYLIKKCKGGLSIMATATSIHSEKMALDGGIPMLDLTKVSSLDLTVDGADEFDPNKQLIKGAGGALVREKIIASMSREMIVIADESKQVEKLGKCPLPVEIIPFGANATKSHLEKLKLSGSWRKLSGGSMYVTDNQNWILDLILPSNYGSCEEVHAAILSIPGIVDTGFFINLAKRIIVGKDDGSTRLLT